MKLENNIWHNAYSNDPEKYEFFKSQLQKLKESREWILETLLSLKKVKTVLEIATGPGLDLEYLHDKFEDLPFKYTGVDYTPKFIEILTDKYPQHTFIEADAMDLPFEDNSFDVVYTRHSLEHMNDPHKELDEIFRLAKKYVIIGWFRLVDSPTSLQIKSSINGEFPMNDLNREEFTERVLDWGTIEDTFTIKHNECWLVKKHTKKGKKK